VRVRPQQLQRRVLPCSLRGTHGATVFYTLCESARLAGVDPLAYLLRLTPDDIRQRLVATRDRPP
jgi:hypothetical protein